MKKILVVGDSHTERLGFGLSDYFINKVVSENFTTSEQHYKIKRDDGLKKFLVKEYLSFYENENFSFMASAHMGRSALNFDFENFGTGSQKKFLSDINSNENIIMPWLGYIDIKNHLPRKNLKNYIPTEEVVDIYVDRVLKIFDKCRVVFIEPAPQFVTFVTTGWHNPLFDPDLDFEDRYEYHLKFVNALRNKCAGLGLDSPISPSNILETDMGFHWMQPKYPINLYLTDHFKQEYYDRILEHIYNFAFIAQR